MKRRIGAGSGLLAGNGLILSISPVAIFRIWAYNKRSDIWLSRSFYMDCGRETESRICVRRDYYALFTQMRLFYLREVVEF